MKQNILLLGGTGFIGRQLIRRLINNDYVVHVIARTADKLPKLDNMYCYTGSLGNRELLRAVLPKCDIVFHLASDTTPGVSALLPAFEAEHNLLPTLDFLEVLQEYPSLYLIYISTGGAIYGDSSDLFAEETSPLLPLSYYGAGKAAIEKFIIAFCHQTSHSSIILRPSNFYGTDQPYRLGFGIIPTIFHHLYERKELSIWGDGESMRDYLFVDDFIDLCLMLINWVGTDNSDGISIYNVGSGYGYSLNQLVRIIETVTGISIQRKYYPARKVDVRRIVLNCDKLKTNFGWYAMTDLTKGLDIIWKNMNK